MLGLLTYDKGAQVFLLERICSNIEYYGQVNAPGLNKHGASLYILQEAPPLTQQKVSVAKRDDRAFRVNKES